MLRLEKARITQLTNTEKVSKLKIFVKKLRRSFLSLYSLTLKIKVKIYKKIRKYIKI